MPPVKTSDAVSASSAMAQASAKRASLASRAPNPYHPDDQVQDYVDRNISENSVNPSSHDLSNHGLGNLRAECWNLPTAALYEEAIHNGEAQIVHLGPLVVRTGQHTGRAAGDKFIVDEPSSREHVAWGDVNKPISEDAFDWLRRKAVAYLQNRQVYCMDVYAGADPAYRMRVRVITENAWHALFVRTMFLRPDDEELGSFVPEFTVIHVPSMKADPKVDHTRSSTFITLNLGAHMAVIGGTFYAGEIKKCVFSAMNFYLPLKGVLTMHAAANVGPAGDSAVFFGLSGTGKTTLSADESRQLIGDDEHGWSDKGVFNIEGGCYAKVIRLSSEAEPVIFNTTRKFGTILENVYMNPVTRRLDLSDSSLTENTRAAYPLQFVPNVRPDSMGPNPKNVIMLTCDAFGVLPPISKLTPAQAEYWFMLGYTAKMAGTEIGVQKPTATFSACFGLPFMPLHPAVYAKLLRERIIKHGVDVWLINTGWTGGIYGTGKRMSIEHTRALLHAALDGSLKDSEYKQHEVFQLAMPTSAPNVPADILDPRNTWSDKAAYDAQAKDLAGLCCKAFAQYKDKVTPEVLGSGPRA